MHGEIVGIDLARAALITMIARVVRGGHVGVADLFSEQLAEASVFYPDRS